MRNCIRTRPPAKHSHRYRRQRLDSYRAELQAVRLLLSGTREWSDTWLWITLDNKAVVEDVQKCIDGKLPTKRDNIDIWPALSHDARQGCQRSAKDLMDQRARDRGGHAAERSITELEQERNKLADQLATSGKTHQDTHDTEHLAARQRDCNCRHHPIYDDKIWKTRREQIDQASLEAELLDEEMQAV